MKTGDIVLLLTKQGGLWLGMTGGLSTQVNNKLLLGSNTNFSHRIVKALLTKTRPLLYFTTQYRQRILGARGFWTSLQARANLPAIYAFHKFLTLSFLSAKALARARAAPAAPCRSCMHFLHST